MALSSCTSCRASKALSTTLFLTIICLMSGLLASRVMLSTTSFRKAGLNCRLFSFRTYNSLANTPCLAISCRKALLKGLSFWRTFRRESSS